MWACEVINSSYLTLGNRTFWELLGGVFNKGLFTKIHKSHPFKNECHPKKGFRFRFNASFFAAKFCLLCFEHSQFNLEGNAMRLSRNRKGNPYISSIKVLVPGAKHVNSS